MARDADEWFHVLRACGVREATARKWSQVFANTIKDNTFSKGDEDLKDFLPTILHESAMLEKMIENGNYSAKRIRELGNASAPGSRWRSLVPRADELANNPTKFFEAAYGGRMGNAPEGSGDGAKFPGRGPIGMTGRDAYAFMEKLAGQDLTVMPHLAEQPHFGLEFAILWWEKKVPDSFLGDIRQIRRVVNGGYFGIGEVEILAAKARAVL